MRVGVDATPLLGPRTGVGTYVANLLTALAAGHRPPELIATAFTGRRRVPLADAVPPGVEVRSRRIPARVLNAFWRRVDWPSLELVTGRVDVFHGTNFRAPPSGRAASVVTIHDLAYLKMPETVDQASLAYQEIVPRALDRGTAVCAVSHAMAAEIMDAYGLSADRVHVTPLGVDPSWLATDATPAEPAVSVLPQDYLLAVGTVEPRKNLASIVQAYRLAGRSGVDLPPLVIAGPAGWGAGLDLSGLAAGQVVSTGYLPFAELQQVVARAALFVFPSLYEGFGLPPLEALACGVPVVASDLAVTREVLGDQSTFTDATSPATLLASIQEALERPVGTRESRRARAASFTWQECARTTMEMYSAVLDQRRA